MKEDNAIKKVLNRRAGDLPFGFENRVMDKIMLEVEKKSRRNYYLSISLVSFISVILIAGTFYLLNVYFSFNILDIFSKISFNIQDRPMFVFCFYIAALILILLGLDFKFRDMIRKK
jgi:uncharacterized Tic20 family protein